MSEALLGVIIGASFGFLGALTGILANTYLDSRRARRERTREVWLRLVGNRVQSSEVTDPMCMFNRSITRKTVKATIRFADKIELQSNGSTAFATNEM